MFSCAMSPRLCGKCSAVTPLPSTVTCGGRCRRSFHLSCVCSSPEASNLWTQDWFCSDCQPDLNSKGYDSLPPEVLEQIFLRLEKRSKLLQMRQVCRHWRDVVDGTPSLIDQFTVKIGKKYSVEDCEPMNLFPARKVVIHDYYPRLAAEKHWWSRLIDLSFKRCKITTSTVFGLIQSAPSLKRINIFRAQIRDEQGAKSEINLELTKLEELCLADVPSDFLSRFLGAFKSTKFPQLKVIKFDGPVQQMIPIIQMAQDTIEDIEVYSSTDVLQELCKIPRLRLKRIYFGTEDHGRFLTECPAWLDFLRMQKDSLESLGMPWPLYSTNELLSTIGKLCPNLDHITANLPHYEPLLPSSLENMKNLQCLDLGYNLNGTPESCTFNKFEDFFLIVERLSNSLRYLSVSGSVETDHMKTYVMSKQFPKLTHLYLFFYGFPITQLMHFLKMCPMLKCVDLVGCHQ